MRFWLTWAIVTLPLGASLYLWGRSYFVEEALQREGHLNELVIGVSRGTLFCTFMRTTGWTLSGIRWSYMRHDHAIGNDYDSYILPAHILGFGYGSQAGPA